MRHILNIFYKPSRIFLIVDISLLILSLYVVLDWFPLTTNRPFDKYSLPSICYIFTWFVCSYLLQRYKPISKQKYFRTSFGLFYTTVFIYTFYRFLIFLFFDEFSENVLLSITIGAFLLNYLFVTIYFAYKYAIEYQDIPQNVEIRQHASSKAGYDIGDADLEELHDTISAHSGNKVLIFLQQICDLRSSNTFVYASSDSELMRFQPHYQYTTIVQLERLNNIQGIYKLFSLVNNKLPDDGFFICCFKSKSTCKKEILGRYFWGLNYVIYSLDFVFKRIIPKIFITRGLYYLITGGKNRTLSKAEVIGRLYCAGFNLTQERKVGELTYFVAQRFKQPDVNLNRTYGPLIRLRRSGRGGEPFVVYKFRTMHPYSEFVQKYIYEKHSLQEGGKFNKDIRVTTIGRFLRRYWLDELPMFYNLIKGDMKLVGVRPLSSHYLSLYSEDLQQLRSKFRPGLLPPFYADMPKTLEEIELSEIKYLNLCTSQGTFKTDVMYFFLILRNIFFKRARSA
jgi:Bacterial sugar transferase